MESQQKQTYSCNKQDDAYFGHSTDAVPMIAKREEVNSSCNHNGPSCIFDMPECVIDVYLQAINGGTSKDEKFRSISQYYGQPEEKTNFNCNHNSKDVPPGYCGGCMDDPCYDPAKNVNPEPKPDQGCGCSFSYNGGAGAGTADCGCDYDLGFNDKKRDHSCPCSSPEAKRSHGMGTSGCNSECPYQRELCNKKAMSSCCTGLSEVEYKPEVVNNKPVLPSCCCEGGPYEKDLVNKKPSICSPCGPEYHPSCTDKKPRHCHLSEYRTRPQDIPDRRCFYSDEECGNTAVIKRCNNNSCNIDLLYDIDTEDDPCAVGVPCVTETSYFHDHQRGILTATLELSESTSMLVRHEEDETEEKQEQAASSDDVSSMYTTVALESDEAGDHLLPELTGGKRWALKTTIITPQPSEVCTDNSESAEK